MENDSEDFFDTFKDKVISKTKKFCFKKVENETVHNKAKEIVTSPFFAKKAATPERALPESNKKLDNSILKDNVEKELDKIFNGAFQDVCINETPRKSVSTPHKFNPIIKKSVGTPSSSRTENKVANIARRSDDKNSTNIAPICAFQDVCINETPSKSVSSHKFNSTLKKSVGTPSKSRTQNNVANIVGNLDDKNNTNIAPVFLFNKKESRLANGQSTFTNTRKEKNCSSGHLSQEHGKKIAKFKFKKTTKSEFPNESNINTASTKTSCTTSFNLQRSNSSDDFLPKPEFSISKSQSNRSILRNSGTNKCDNDKKPSCKSPVHSNCIDSVSACEKQESNTSNQEALDGSPVIRPKKFIFKKKISSTSSSSQSQLFTNKSLKEKSAASPRKALFTETPNKTKERTLDDSPIIVSSNESFPGGNNLKKSDTPHITKITEVKKNLFSDKILDDKISFVSQSLEASDADYMTDEQFEKMFGINSSGFEATATSPTAHVDEFDLNDIDWDDQFSPEESSSNNIQKNKADVSEGSARRSDIFSQESAHPPEFLGARGDDSAEFRKNYHFSGVMMEVLHEKFGLINFRPHQREIINASLNRNDIFVLMPTGGGKSLCYQLPAILSEGVTVVISPLRALISDQVDKLNGLDIASAHLCADMSLTDTNQVLSKLHMREPGIKLLYLTPEKIMASKSVMDVLDSLYQRGKLVRFVIDEAHCLSQWGHDFRPDYKQLSILRRKFEKVPVICLTATATKQVETDVVNILKLKSVKRFIRSFNRPNIKYQVLPKTGKTALNEIANMIKTKFMKKSGIIYCLSRNDCQDLSKNLNSMGIKSKPYHAGMSSKVREDNQRQWMQDRFHVIVATIAFGMGIDKPDVRFVIHNSIPKSVEAFYQESGRAGRDGETSYSYLYYSYGDVARLQKIMQLDKKANKKALDGHFENLKQMVAFAENVVECRRHLQLLHLGENFDRQICIQNKETTCDNCENFRNYDMVDITKEAKELATLVRDISTKSNVTLCHIVDVYRGSKIKKILDKGHNSQKYYGAGSNMDRLQVNRILRQLILKNVLTDHHMYTGEFPVVYIKPGTKFNTLNVPDAKFTLPISTKKPQLPVLVESVDPGPSTSGLANKNVAVISKYKMSTIKVQCHEDLLEECRRLALERNLTLSSIMNLSALKSMSEALPKTKEEFLKIQHVTAANFNKFGEYFLKITTKHRETLDALQTPQSFSSETFDESDDWGSSSQSRKRKSTGGYKKSYKRFKRGGKAKRQPRAKGKTGTPKKKRVFGKGKTKGGIDLMPVHVK